ncbi:MAG TPA: hypothetical protein VM493_07880 [Vicinamibacterales bacterium]|nr:hypothetical protein [Vicinamibacterales bacterium]
MILWGLFFIWGLAIGLFIALIHGSVDAIRRRSEWKRIRDARASVPTIHVEVQQGATVKEMDAVIGEWVV